LQAFRAAVGAGFDAADRLGSVVDAVPGEAFDIIVGDADAINYAANGDFADASVWVPDAGWSIAAGKATHATGVTDWIRQAVSGLANGTFIRATFTVSGRTAGGTGFRATGSSGFVQTTVPATVDGVYTEAFVTPTDVDDLAFYGGSTFDGSIDDVFAVISTPESIPHGLADFWLVPVTVSGAEGTPVGPFTLQIP
jgi:hypothetical protein